MSGVNIVLPSYRGGVRYDCKNCNAFCCNYGYLILDKMTMAEILRKMPHLHLYAQKESEYYNVDMGGCSCWFLEKGGCAIQPIKPISCTLFPNRIIKGPENFYVILQTLCPNAVWTDERIDRILLYEKIIDSCPSLIQDYGIKFKAYSFQNGRPLTWENRFVLEYQVCAELNVNLGDEVELTNMENSFVCFYWNQIRLIPYFLETDFAIVNSLKEVYLTAFVTMYQECPKVLKSIQHATKMVTDELYIKYKYFQLDVAVVEHFRKTGLMESTHLKFLNKIMPYISEAGGQLLSDIKETCELNQVETIGLLKCLQRCQEVSWTPCPYKNS